MKGGIQLLDEASRAIVVAEIGADGFGMTVRRPDILDDGRRFRGTGVVMDQHAGPIPSEALGDGGANPPGGPGDEGELVRK